jgi:hypothetical protein
LLFEKIYSWKKRVKQKEKKMSIGEKLILSLILIVVQVSLLVLSVVDGNRHEKTFNAVEAIRSQLTDIVAANASAKHEAVAAPTLAINCWDRVVSYPMRTPKKSCEAHSNEKCSYWSPPAWGYEVGQTAMQCGKTPDYNCPDFPVEAECCVFVKNANALFGIKPPCIGTFPLPRP